MAIAVVVYHLEHGQVKLFSSNDILNRRLRLVALLIPIIPGAGCVSTDAEADRDLSVSLAQSRLNRADASEVLGRSPLDPPRSWNGTDPLDVDTAVEVAFERDADVRRTMALVDLARAELAQEDRAPNPTLSFNVGIAIDGIAGAPAFAMLAQQVTWLWTRPWRIEAADAERRASILRAASSIVDLDARIRRRHAETTAADELAIIDRNFANITRQSMDLVGKRVNAGEASQLDLDRAVVEARKAEVTAERSEIDARARRLTLLADLGLPSSHVDFEIVGSLDHGDSAIPTDSQVIALSATARLDVAASGMDLLAAEAKTGLARTKRIPEVTATLNWTRNISDRDALGPGARIGIPIFDDGTPGIAAAESSVRAKAFALLETQRNAIAQARLIREDLIAATVQANGYRERILAPARLAERRAELAYEEGVSDLTVLLLAQQRRIDAERQALVHELQATILRIDLARAVGGSIDLEPIAPDVPTIAEMDSRSPKEGHP